MKAIKRIGDHQVVIRSGEIMIPVDTHDIIYVEHVNRSVVFCTLRGAMELPYRTLEEVRSELEDDLSQCHRSYLINERFISGWNIAESCVYLKNGDLKIPLGATYKKNFMKYFYSDKKKKDK